MKTKYGVFFGIAVLLMTAIFTLAGCDNPAGSDSGNGGEDSNDGTLTFDSLPQDEQFSIFISTATTTNYRTTVNAAENRDNKTVAVGSYLVTSNNAVSVSGNGNFDPNGAYTVIYWKEFKAPEIKYQIGVQFSNGNASITFSGMTLVEYEAGDPATLTFTDSPPSGTFKIFVSSAVVTDYQTAVTAASTINNDLYAGSDQDGLNGIIITLNTIDDFNTNGTYTVIYVNDATPLEMKYQSGVQFSSGSASISFSGMTTVGGSENALVIEDFSYASECSVLVTTANPATVAQMGQNSAGVGVIEQGENFVSWINQPANGTYTVILQMGSSFKKATGVTITGGVGSVSYSTFVNLPLM
jgi:hypothetical protein